ncbi:MAG: transcription repressor NadR [Clostridiales bacterium]|nr:transcription repressor NadR [Clostridiales bacterium]
MKFSEIPLSGTELAQRLKVSRQIIVQDIALLRATNKNILATNKGYLLFVEEKTGKCQRAIKVKHENDAILDELYTIVDYGGKLLNVVIEHGIYGQILVDLIICNREDANIFVKAIEENSTKPLTELTNGIHWHTIEAASERQLDQIVEKLEQKGYLIK